MEGKAAVCSDFSLASRSGPSGGEHSSLKLTFALHREELRDTVYIGVGCQNVFIVSHIFLQCPFGETECRIITSLFSDLSLSELRMSAKC